MSLRYLLTACALFLVALPCLQSELSKYSHFRDKELVRKVESVLGSVNLESGDINGTVGLPELELDNGNFPVVPPTLITRRIENAGEVCMHKETGTKTLVTTMRPPGCWASGCYDINKKYFSISTNLKPIKPGVTDSPQKPVINLSSLFIFTTRDRLICPTDCGGLGQVEKKMVLGDAPVYSVLYGNESVGEFMANQTDEQCFRTIKGYVQLIH